MKTTHFLLASCLSLAPLTTVATAQVDISEADELTFSLRRVLPRYVPSEDLYQTLQAMYGRELNFEDRLVDNLALLEDSIVIYETQDRQQRILDAIAQLDINLEEIYEEAPSVSPSEMVLESYLPRYLQSSDFFEIAWELYGREILIDDNWHDNLRPTGTGLLVYEKASEVSGLMEKLKHLDESQAPQTGGEIIVQHYQPRHLSSYSLVQSLNPFRGAVRDSSSNNSSSPNISVLEGRGTIVIRDYSDRVAQILASLESLDKPAPQVMIVCQVLQGVGGDATRPAAEDLTKQLLQLLPYDSYQVDANGMLRGSAVAGTAMQIKMMADSKGREYNLKMRIGAFDPETGALDLNECELSLFDPETGNHDLFGTSATIFQDEYAVLGVTGAEPVFLVVQLRPVQAAR